MAPLSKIVHISFQVDKCFPYMNETLDQIHSIPWKVHTADLYTLVYSVLLQDYFNTLVST